MNPNDEWDEITQGSVEPALTAEQLRELRRRLDDHRENPRRYATWEEVRDGLERLGSCS